MHLTTCWMLPNIMSWGGVGGGITTFCALDNNSGVITMFIFKITILLQRNTNSYKPSILHGPKNTRPSTRRAPSCPRPNKQKKCDDFSTSAEEQSAVLLGTSGDLLPGAQKCYLPWEDILRVRQLPPPLFHHPRKRTS